MNYVFFNFGNRKNTAIEVLLPSEPEASSSFVSVWKTDNDGITNSNQIRLPLISTGEYDFVVDWGDDTTSNITAYNSADITHTYTTAGTYTVTIDGTIRGWQFYWDGDYTKIINISNWGSLHIDNDYAFAGCNNMDLTATDTLTVSGDVSEMFVDVFYGYSFGTNTTTILDFSKWNTAGVTHLSSLFSECHDLVNVDLSNWNVSNVVDISSIFFRCLDLVEVDFSNWNTSNIINMYGLFNQCNDLESIVGISDWNTGSVTNMSRMFYSCTLLTDIDLSSWDFRLVSNFSEFARYTTLSNVSYGKLWDRFYAQKDDMLNSRSFHGGGSKLTIGSSAEVARDYFVNTKGWTVVDGGSS